MDAAVEQLQTLLDLEARHDDLLDRLAELDQRVAEVLAGYQTPRAPQPAVRSPGDGAADGLVSGRGPEADKAGHL